MPVIHYLLITFTPFYFIHYPDPQIGRNIYTIPYCSLAVYQISQLVPAPAFIIVPGDMANNETNQNLLLSQWHICDSIFDQLSIPKYYMPGNHDIGYATDTGWTIAKLMLYRNFWGADYYPFEYDSCLFINLNATLLDTYSGHQCYSYSLQQDSLLRNTLNSAPPGRYKHIFLAFHFPLYVASPYETNSPNNVDRPRRDTLLSYLTAYRITAVFTGHLHSNLMNFFGSSLLQTGPGTCETNINVCGYRPVKVFKNGIETYTIYLNVPVDSVPMMQIVTASVNPETTTTGYPVNFNCIVDSINFPQWKGLTYVWRFGNGQTAHQPNTVYAYPDTGHYNVSFTAYKNPDLCALYYFKVAVLSQQAISKEHTTIIKKFFVSPIITDKKLFFKTTNRAELLIDIYNAQGQCVIHRKINCPNEGTYCIDLKNESPGVYFGIATVQSQTFRTKFILIK